MNEPLLQVPRRAHLLDRPIPDDYLDDRTAHVAAERTGIEIGTKSVVIFRLFREWFALPTTALQEVDEHRPSHTVPHHRGGILNGIVTVRGELLLSISLAALLQLDTTLDARDLQKSRERLLICRRQGDRFAFPVHEVHGVFRYAPARLREVPATLSSGPRGAYVAGVFRWTDRTVGCLDDDLLFYAVNKGLS